MIVRLRSLVARISDSLLAIPLLIIAISVVIAWLAISIDSRGGLSGVPLISTDPESGRLTLATIAGSVLTAAALVFAVMALMVQQAATQYSLRVVQGFLRDRVQQMVVGFVIGTFVYCLLVLANTGTVPTDDHPAAQGGVAITLAVLFAIASMVAIVWFIDHMVRLIRVDTTVAHLAAETSEAVNDLRKEAAGVTVDTQLPEGDPIELRSPRFGWLQGIDTGRLASRLPPGAVLRVYGRIGDHIAEGDRLADLWAKPTGGNEIKDLLEETVTVPTVRTVAHDPGYGFQQMTDIALRALSLAINDPTTASDVVQQLVGPLRILLERPAQPKVIVGDQGQTVALPDRRSKTDFVRMTLGQIRIHASHQPQVLETLVAVCGELISGLERRDFFDSARVIRDEARRVLDLVVDKLPPADANPIVERAHSLGITEG